MGQLEKVNDNKLILFINGISLLVLKMRNRTIFMKKIELLNSSFFIKHPLFSRRINYYTYQYIKLRNFEPRNFAGIIVASCEGH